jgi:nitrate reductase beta subunit
MRVMAQMGMVMNLDKCIGCHTCSVTCKQAWTNRAGTEYVWFHNVETRPGQGYPRRYEDQETWQGGWTLNSRGRLKLKAGGRFKKLLGIFASPVQPKLADYYEPWTYDYQTLIDAPLGDDFPVARPKSLITGENTKITWSANWDDNLGGVSEQGHLDPMVQRVRQESEDKIKFAFQQNLHVLSATHLRALPEPVMYGVLSLRRDLQARRRWHRLGRSRSLPRLAAMRDRLPVQEDLLQPQDRQGRKVHLLLSAGRGRIANGLFRDLCRAAALPRPVPL